MYSGHNREETCQISHHRYSENPLYFKGMKTCIRLLFLLLVLASCDRDYAAHSLPMIEIYTSSDIRPDVKINGEMTLFLEGEKILESSIGVEYRGSTSYRMSDKKSMSIETRIGDEARNQSLLGLPAESDWVLMGHVFRANNADDFYAFDPTLMHHYISYEWARNMGQYASRCRWVEVTVNGEYLGVYVLMEKLKADAQRIDVGDPNGTTLPGITGGYILKIDKTSGDGPTGQPLEYYDNNWGDDAVYKSSNSFRSHYDIYGDTLGIEPFRPPYHDQQWRETYFLYEHPGPAEMNYEQRTYIQNYLHDFEKALAEETFTDVDRRYLDYIDLESFVSGFIINELAGNIDAYRISTFLHKPKNGKLRFGPVWDFNIGYGRQGRVPWDDWIANYNDHVTSDAWMVPFWWQTFLQDPVFQRAVKSRWAELRATTLSDAAVLGLVNETESYLVSHGAVARNYNKWQTLNGTTVDHASEVEFLRNYLNQRLSWMDGEIGSW